MISMLIQRPSIIAAGMVHILIYVFYYRLSKREEEEMIKAYGDEYRWYMEKTPMFHAKMGRKRNAKSPV